VFRASNGVQRPWIFADMIGDFYFKPVTTGPITLNRSQSYVEAGQKLYQQGSFEAAAGSFDQAVRIDPENAFGYNALGSARARLKQWSEAVSLYGKAIEIKPDYAAAYFNRGVAYNNAGRFELAVQDFSWAIDEEPYDPRILDLRGRAYLSLRDQDHALADFDRAIELNSSDSEAFMGRGMVAFRQGDYQKALREFTQSIELRPSAEAYERRADTFQSLRRTADADGDLKKAAAMRARK